MTITLIFFQIYAIQRMNVKDDMEDGEISDISDREISLGHYTPLERPVTAKAVLPQNCNDGKLTTKTPCMWYLTEY